TDDNAIGLQTAGTPFNIRVHAVDAHDNKLLDFTGTVDLTTSSVFNAGGGTTAAFVNGELTSHSVTLTASGTNHTITVTHTGGSESGISNEFDITVGALAQLAFGVQPVNTVSDETITPAVTVR